MKEFTKPARVRDFNKSKKSHENRCTRNRKLITHVPLLSHFFHSMSYARECKCRNVVVEHYERPSILPLLFFVFRSRSGFLGAPARKARLLLLDSLVRAPSSESFFSALFCAILSYAFRLLFFFFFSTIHLPSFVLLFLLSSSYTTRVFVLFPCLGL